MRKARKSLWTNTAASLALSAITGSLCGMAAVLLGSAFVYFLMDDMKLIGKTAAAALIVSGYAGGFLCGKFRRKRGLIEGGLCGVLIYALIGAFAAAFTGKLPALWKLLLLLSTGAAGGVIGVNSKRPKSLMS